MNYTTIPIDLAIYAVNNRRYDQIQLYVFFKLQGSGFIHPNKSLRSEYLKESDKCERSYYNTLKWLKNERWVYPVSDGLRVISYKRLLKKLYPNQELIKQGTLFEYPLKDLRAFLCASLICFYGKKLKWADKQSGINKRDAIIRLKSADFILPHSYLSKQLGISKSTAANLRYKAKPYVTSKKQFENVGINVSEIKVYKKYHPEIANHIRVRKTKKGFGVFIQHPDLLTSNIHFRRKKLTANF